MLGELLSLGGNLLNNYFAGERQEDAQQFSAQQFATRYQTTVKDLQAAGLSPMLAYQQGGGSPPSSSAASAAGGADLGMVHLQSKMNAAQVANVEADTENKRDSSALIQAQIAETLASAQGKGEMVSQIQATTNKINEEIKNIKSENIRIEATIHNLAEHTALLREQGKTESVRRAQIMGVIEQLRLSNLITSADYDAMVKSNFVGRLAREVKPIGDMTTDLLDSLKLWKGKTRRESGTTYDRSGRESGGYSRETYER